MADTIQIKLNVDGKEAQSSLEDIAKIAQSASGFMITLGTAMNTAKTAAGGLSAVLGGATGLGLALGAVSLALQILPNLFSDSTEEMERQKEAARQLREELSKLTREQLQQKKQQVEADLQSAREGQDYINDLKVDIKGNALGNQTNYSLFMKNKYDDEVKNLQSELVIINDALYSLGDIENVENRLRINELKKKELNEQNYKEKVKVKDIEKLTYEQAKDILKQWIEYDKKLLYGENKSTQAKKTFDELEQELKASQSQQEMAAAIQNKGDYSLQLLKKRHLDEMIALYKQYGKDVTALQEDLSNTEAAINKRTDIKNVQAAPMTSVTPIPKELAPTKEFGDSQAYADDWQKGWADRERDELDLAEAAELEKADIYANSEEMKTAIHEKYSKYRLSIDQEEALAQAQIYLGALNFISGAIAEHTVAGKAISIANATMSTYEAAAKALTAGPIIGGILAGMVVTAGLANVAKIAAVEPPKMPGYASGGIVVGEKGPEIIAPMQDYASGQALLVQQTVMEARRALTSAQHAQASGDNQSLIIEMQKLNANFEGYSNRPITITKDAVGKIVTRGNSQLRKSRV